MLNEVIIVVNCYTFCYNIFIFKSVKNNYNLFLLSYCHMQFPVVITLDHHHLIPEYVVAQVVEALHYKSEGRGFETRWSL